MDEILQAFVEDLHQLFGADLVAAYLYGSGATGEHIPGRSDINTLVVLRRVTPETLRRATGRLRVWGRQGMATPLFLDPDFLRSGVDVFAIEFFDMQARHRVLWGPDLLAELYIGPANLRRQCEQELRGKLLKLRQTYAESSQSPRQLEAVLVAAVAGLAVLARALLCLGGGASGGSAEETLERVSRRFGVPTASLVKAARLKGGQIRVTGANLELLYREVLEEFQRLVTVVDDLPA
jgi:predicted nucleotidyltransferase